MACMGFRDVGSCIDSVPVFCQGSEWPPSNPPLRAKLIDQIPRNTLLGFVSKRHDGCSPLCEC